MSVAEQLSQASFYREFLMAREAFNPRDFGVDMDRGPFLDLMVDEFGAVFRGQWSIDEMLLHPRDAMWFCDSVRRKHGFFDLPDDVILRAIMNRRKNPGG